MDIFKILPNKLDNLAAQRLIMECLQVCIEKQDEHSNFWPFIEHIRPMILSINKKSVFHDVGEVLGFLIQVIDLLWEKGKPQLLTELLTHRKFEMLVNNDKVQTKLNVLLMKSCRKENDFSSEMVKVLVKNECRLYLSTEKTNIVDDSWR